MVASSRMIRFDGDFNEHLFSAELVRIRRFNFADIISSIRVFVGNNRECGCLIETKARKIACRSTIRMQNNAKCTRNVGVSEDPYRALISAARSTMMSRKSRCLMYA